MGDKLLEWLINISNDSYHLLRINIATDCGIFILFLCANNVNTSISIYNQDTEILRI